MRIFYLEEKLAKVEDGSHAHPPSQDAQALLHTYESTIERLTEQVKTLNGEKISLSSRVAEMSSDLNMSKNRLDQSKVRENYDFETCFVRNSTARRSFESGCAILTRRRQY